MECHNGQYLTQKFLSHRDYVLLIENISISLRICQSHPEFVHLIENISLSH